MPCRCGSGAGGPQRGLAADEVDLGTLAVENDGLREDLFVGSADEAADLSVILPRDDRFPIRAQARRPSTLLFPFNTICFIEAWQHGRFVPWGTGTLIAPQVVLTAKHVLQDVSPPCRPSAATGPFVPALRITPGADLSSGDPRLQRPASPASVVARRERFRADPLLDYGVVILPEPFRLRNPGGFMLLQPRSRYRTATLLTIAGYPCDKPVGTMWGHSDRIPLTGVSPTHLRYRIDTCPGHSGSPIWLLGNDGIRLLLGVHTTGAGGPFTRCPNAPSGRCRPTGVAPSMAAGENCGVRVTCRVIRFIEAVCRAFRVAGPRVDRVTYRRICA